jgi:hypothetical protein
LSHQLGFAETKIVNGRYQLICFEDGCPKAQFLQPRVLLPLGRGGRVPLALFFGRASHPLGLFLGRRRGGAMKSAA